MSRVLSLRRRPKTEDAADEDLVESLPPIASGTYQTSSNMAAKAATAGLMTCLVLGPIGAVAGALALLQVSQPAPVQQAKVVDQSNERAIAGEFAQRVVLTWLASTRESPQALTALVKDAQVATLPELGFTATDPTVARITQSDGVWSVTVAATVTDARKQTARRFYQVPVQVNGTAVTALTLPAPVSPPAVEAPPRTEYRNQLGASSAVGSTVTQFLGAYLAGSGDVSRYLTPGASLTAISPAPFTAVKLEDLRANADADADATPKNGTRMRVLATATVTVTAKQSSSVTYALSLTARAGRWEITSIDPAPALALSTPGAASAPGTPALPSESAMPTQSGTPPSASTP